MIYLGRICEMQDADSLEEAMEHPERAGQIGKYDRNNAIPSNATVRLGEEYRKNSVANAYARETADTNLYFMVGESAEEVAYMLRTCAMQPVGPDAMEKLDYGTATAEDVFGGDRVSALVLEMTDDEYAEAVNMGKIGTGEGTYEVDGGQEQLSEALLGDRILREIFSEKNGRVYIYDGMHYVLDKLGAPLDEYIIPATRRTPYRVNNTQKARIFKNDTSTEKNKGLTPEQAEALKWLLEQKKSGTFSTKELNAWAKGVGLKNIDEYTMSDDD